MILTGLPGVPGEKGKDGQDGQDGLPGVSGFCNGYFVTRHSQTNYVPECPEGLQKMWDGYSLLFVQGNERAHGQDLGKFLVHCIEAEINIFKPHKRRNRLATKGLFEGLHVKWQPK